MYAWSVCMTVCERYVCICVWGVSVTECVFMCGVCEFMWDVVRVCGCVRICVVVVVSVCVHICMVCVVKGCMGGWV